MALGKIIFQGLGENTCSLQPALKNTAPGLYRDPQRILILKLLEHCPNEIESKS